MQAQAARVELLQQMPIFGAISDAALQFLLDKTRSVSVMAGDFFFHEGGQADSMYVLEAGSVTVVRTWCKREFVVSRLGTGDCFGELALLDLFPRSASVRADENCTAIVLTPSDLHSLFQYDSAQFAVIQMNIGRELCRRLRMADERLFRTMMGEKSTMTDACRLT